MDKESFFQRSFKIMRGATAGSVIEQSEFMQSIAVLTRNAWQAGWHAAGGSFSYRMKSDEVGKCRSSFVTYLGDWIPFGVRVQDMQDEYFVVTADGSGFETLAYDLSSELGIIEINNTGDSWRRVWGFERTGNPTRELLTHFMTHAVRKRVTSGAQRVAYHAYLPSLDTIASQKNPQVLPEGVGLCSVSIMGEYPGAKELAQENAELFETNTAVAWPNNGVLCTSNALDDTFDILTSIEEEATAAL